MKPKFKSRKKFFFIIPIALLFIITAIVMWLWNSILPDVLSITAITYWQAMGILILSKILFGGFPGCKKRHHGKHKKQLIRKMKNMTPEEREKFKAMWKQRFESENFCGH